MAVSDLLAALRAMTDGQEPEREVTVRLLGRQGGTVATNVGELVDLLALADAFSRLVDQVDTVAELQADVDRLYTQVGRATAEAAVLERHAKILGLALLKATGATEEETRAVLG